MRALNFSQKGFHSITSPENFPISSLGKCTVSTDSALRDFSLEAEVETLSSLFIKIFRPWSRTDNFESLKSAALLIHSSISSSRTVTSSWPCISSNVQNLFSKLLMASWMAPISDSPSLSSPLSVVYVRVIHVVAAPNDLSFSTVNFSSDFSASFSPHNDSPTAQ